MNRKFDNDEYRNTWLETHVKHLLASQFRALRGDERQGDFGEKIGASQSVVARYENPAYGKMTLNTLLEIAKRLKIGLQVRFVPFSTVMDEAKRLEPSDLAPVTYAEDMRIRDARALALANGVQRPTRRLPRGRAMPVVRTQHRTNRPEPFINIPEHSLGPANQLNRGRPHG